MVLTDKDNLRRAEPDEELLTFDVSDETLERAAPIGGQAIITRVYGTAADCGYCVVGVPKARLILKMGIGELLAGAVLHAEC